MTHQEMWDLAVATTVCPNCGALPGAACEPPGFRPHRARFDHLEFAAETPAAGLSGSKGEG